MLSKTLRPGLLVGLSTTIKGNVDYSKVEIDEDHLTDEGTREATWQTTRIIQDAEEHEKAIKVRSKARSLITGVCAKSDFGYLCPDNKIGELEKAIKEAERICMEFNLTANITEINCNILTGRIEADSARAIRAISVEIAGLIETMENGLKRGLPGVEEVRAAANKAKKLGTMLDPADQAKLQESIDLARSVAVKLVKAGDQAAEIVDQEAIAALESARTAYLDLDSAGEVSAFETEGRAIDLDPLVSAPDLEVEAPKVDFDVEDLM